MSRPQFLHTRIPIALLGASTAILQVLAIREGMAASGGNEAVLAALLGVWMVLTAAGAALGRHPVGRICWLPCALVAHGASAPLTIVAARLSVRLLPAGAIPSVGWSTLAALVVLSPCCLLSGWAYAQLASTGANRCDDQQGVGRRSAYAYLFDTLGSGIAGVVLAIWVLDHALPFQVASIATVSSLLAASTLISRPLAFALPIGSLITATVLCAAPLDRITYDWQLSGQRVLDARSSARGALIIAASSGQTQVLLGREPILTVPDDQHADWAGYVALGLHPDPHDVLVIGVAPAGAAARMASQGVHRIDEVVGDPKVGEAVRTWDPSSRNSRVRIIADDERAWARNASSQYDVVLVDTMPPTSISGARLFSLQFYRQLRACLRPLGVVIVKAPAHAAYASMEQRRMHSAIASTLRAVFQRVLALPGPDTWYLATDQQLPAADKLHGVIQERLLSRGVDEGVVNADWLNDAFASHRLSDAHRWSLVPMPPSTDTHPIVYRLALDATLAHLGDEGVLALHTLSFLLALFVFAWFNPRERPISFSVVSTGMAGIVLQLVLMIVYQTAVAALFRDVALVTSVFMAASCLGTWQGARSRYSQRALAIVDVVQVLVALTVAASCSQVVSLGGGRARLAVVVLSAAIGGASGFQIALATRSPELASKGPAGAAYAIDLVGSALAALATCTVVIPALGIVGTAMSLAAVKAVSSIAQLVRPQPFMTGQPKVVPWPALLLVSAVSLGIVDESARFLAGASTSGMFSICVLITLLGMLCLAFEPRTMHTAFVSFERRMLRFRRAVLLSPAQTIPFLLLLPLAALPLAKCYFKVPYIFCHACPRPCVFGIMRPYVVPAACLANLHDRHFCSRVCPIGHAQSACERIRMSSKRRWIPLAHAIRLLAFTLVAMLYPLLIFGRSANLDRTDVFNFFFRNTYATSSWVLAVSGALLIVSFVLHRPFCEALCPIGAMADWVGRLEKRWLSSSQGCCCRQEGESGDL